MGARQEPIEPLKAIVDEAYRLFERPPPPDDGVCNCCVEPDFKARFLKWPVREIPLGDMREWYFAATVTPMPMVTMRWIAPRILDGLARGEHMAAVGDEVVLERLALAGFPDDWLDLEVELIDRFGAAFAAALVEGGFGDRPEMDLDECLCMLARGGIAMIPVLARLDRTDTGNLARAIGCMEEVGWNAFWDDAPARDVVLGWFHTDSMLERLLAYGAGDGPGNLRDQALRVAETILAAREAA